MARPAFQPTAALRKKVSICAGGGMSHEELALALGISRPTLEKHFALELSVGAYQRRAEVLSAIHRAALKGNITAAREFLKLDPQLAAPPAPAPAPATKAAAPLGKKDQAKQDATTAHIGTEWGALLPTPAASKLQ
jgi:hypothetical protein